ncbi:hypothetical protein TNCV_462071 [Trichonephila clavipes]|uniref:Uncharacterized protein n=1 Tax=Trichonephila clavipes TaxID=2585209 RepID=A0A8X6R688_TRICX|nr:hypothetical protein TNCV_462071 [Trichonephila clavipes]
MSCRLEIWITSQKWMTLHENEEKEVLVGNSSLQRGLYVSGMKKMDGDCKAKLAAGTVGFEAGVSLFTDPISDFDEEVLHGFNCVLEIDTLGERRRVICEKTCTDRVVLWKVICENVVKIRG